MRKTRLSEGELHSLTQCDTETSYMRTKNAPKQQPPRHTVTQKAMRPSSILPLRNYVFSSLKGKPKSKEFARTLKRLSNTQPSKPNKPTSSHMLPSCCRWLAQMPRSGHCLRKLHFGTQRHAGGTLCLPCLATVGLAVQLCLHAQAYLSVHEPH